MGPHTTQTRHVSHGQSSEVRIQNDAPKSSPLTRARQWLPQSPREQCSTGSPGKYTRPYTRTPFWRAVPGRGEGQYNHEDDHDRRHRRGSECSAPHAAVVAGIFTQCSSELSDKLPPKRRPTFSKRLGNPRSCRPSSMRSWSRSRSRGIGSPSQPEPQPAAQATAEEHAQLEAARG